MVTLGVASILYELANRFAELTGGADGLQGVVIGPLLGRFAFGLDGKVSYLYSLTMLVLLFVLARRVAHSPFGHSLQAIRDNRLRAGMVAVENTPSRHNLVVCTLCSCYPWPVLGLPPAWYKSAPYRARAVKDPRGVLADFGVRLPDATEIRVFDSTAEVRYLVIPQRPEGTDGMRAAPSAKAPSAFVHTRCTSRWSVMIAFLSCLTRNRRSRHRERARNVRCRPESSNRQLDACTIPSALRHVGVGIRRQVRRGDEG